MTKAELNEELDGIYSALKVGSEFRKDPEYTSLIVSFLKDGENELIVYKDWNKYKNRYDYHVDYAHIVCYNIHLYRQSNYGIFGEGKER